MKSMANVTVVIPAYNAALTLRRALASVAAQTQKPQEVLIVDDASTDDTVAVTKEEIKRYPSLHVRLVKHAENRGPAAARNSGWAEAESTYIAFLDADDAWHPRKLELQFAWMADHAEFGLTGHRHSELAEGEAHVNIPRAPEVKRVGVLEFLISNQFATPTAMLRRDLPYRFAKTKRYAEDYLLWLQAALDGVPIAYIDAPLAAIYKPAFGASGLSGRLWDMEVGELAMYWQLRRERRLGALTAVLLSAFSLAKYVRRCALVAFRSRPVGK